QLFAQGNGTINGHITDESTGEALIRVTVIISGTTIGAATDLDGNYTITNVPAGTYSLVFSLISYQTITKDEVVVSANQTMQLDIELSTSAIELGNVTVYAASRKNEKITEAPTAVSVIGLEEIRLKSNSGSVPKLLETQPGVDLVQSGVDDFNLNTRGFNSSVTRRVLVLIDGRDLGAAFLGQQEWGAISYPLDDVSNVEFVRGPGSALYGTNAFNGVLSITTFSPQQALGTKIKLTGGELSMFGLDIRNAGLLGAGFSYRVNVGYMRSDNWDANRITAPFKYPGLDPELREITDGSLKRMYGSARLDYQFADGSLITAEGGITVVENNVIVTGIGRLNLIKGVRPWGKLNYSSEHLYISAWGQSRTTPGSIFSLASGGELIENSTLYQIEGQYNYSFFQEKLRVIVGGSQKIGHVDMEETAMVGTKDYTITGGYGQLEYKPVDQLKFVATGRVDRTSYEKSRFSPRFAAVWSFLPNHSLRVSFNKAFLLPSISEYFLRVLAGGTDLSALGVNPGGPTFVYAMGNAELVPERIEGYEVGYKGIFLDNKLFITLDGYVNKVRDFITDLLQGVNPEFPFNGAPAGLDSLIFYGSPENGIPALPGLTILPSGETAIVISYANKGQVNERGLELSFNYYITDEFLLSANWSYFDFDIDEQQEGDELLPNNPKHKFGYSVRYTHPNGFDAELSGRSVQAFDWAAGVFVGRIPEYHLFNLSAGYQFSQRYRAGLTVTNLLDRQAYQIFGGSIVGRQLIASITVTL
ncbi:MAG: hypothetical protein DRQ01_03250, partial [Ignavibacteriae bacterium]